MDKTRDEKGRFTRHRRSIIKKNGKEYKKCTMCDEVKEVENFYLQKKKLKHGISYICSSRCKKCTNEVNKKYSGRYKEYYKQYRIDNKEKIKEKNKRCHREGREKWIKWLSEVIDMKCKICGYDKYFEVLDFHHEESNTKETELWKIMKFSMNEERKDKALKELKKGYFLCSNCHREIHIKEKKTINEVIDEVS